MSGDRCFLIPRQVDKDVKVGQGVSDCGLILIIMSSWSGAGRQVAPAPATFQYVLSCHGSQGFSALHIGLMVIRASADNPCVEDDGAKLVECRGSIDYVLHYNLMTPKAPGSSATQAEATIKTAWLSAGRIAPGNHYSATLWRQPWRDRAPSTSTWAQAASPSPAGSGRGRPGPGAS